MTFWWSLVNLINFKINLQFKNCLSENCILWHLLIRLYHGDSDKFNKVKVDINYIARGFDPVKYLKEAFSRVGYACEMNFDPFTRHHIFSFFFLTSRVENAPLLYLWLHRKSKVDQSSFSNNLKVDQTSSSTRGQRQTLKYGMPRKWIKVHSTCIFNTW